MKKYIFLLIIILLTSCTSTKVELKKNNLADTNITFKKQIFNDFESAFKALHPEEAYSLAETYAQKTAAKALDYVIQNKYEDAVKTFTKTGKDSLDRLWKWFPANYYENNPKFNIDFIEDSVVIPISLQKGFPIVKIKINGKYYHFFIDTGCSISLIGKNIATANNIIYSDIELNGITIDGFLKYNLCLLPELYLGSIKVSNIHVAGISRDDAINVRVWFIITWFQCDGIMGWDLLSKFDATIDYKNQQLILRKPIKKKYLVKNLYWWCAPVVKFYSQNNYPLLFLLDTGTNMTSFYQISTLSKILAVDTNNIKSENFSFYGINDATITEKRYEYSNFQCYTISNNEISYLTTNRIFAGENLDMDLGMNNICAIDAVLGSDWFKDKLIRIDMTNGIFKISE